MTSTAAHSPPARLAADPVAVAALAIAAIAAATLAGAWFFQLVIGLPHTPADKDAHAWVELAGTDVGPPPGRASHEELARFK